METVISLENTEKLIKSIENSIIEKYAKSFSEEYMKIYPSCNLIEDKINYPVLRTNIAFGNHSEYDSHAICSSDAYKRKSYRTEIIKSYKEMSENDTSHKEAFQNCARILEQIVEEMNPFLEKIDPATSELDSLSDYYAVKEMSENVDLWNKGTYNEARFPDHNMPKNITVKEYLKEHDDISEYKFRKLKKSIIFYLKDEFENVRKNIHGFRYSDLTDEERLNITQDYLDSKSTDKKTTKKGFFNNKTKLSSIYTLNKILKFPINPLKDI
jgi:hypothetical protein